MGRSVFTLSTLQNEKLYESLMDINIRCLHNAMKAAFMS